MEGAKVFSFHISIKVYKFWGMQMYAKNEHKLYGLCKEYQITTLVYTMKKKKYLIERTSPSLNLHPQDL